jgi:hypothetical protein
MEEGMNWYAKNGSGGQGIVIDEDTGRSVAVAYDVKDAPLLAAAPEMAEALRECRIALTFYREWMHAHTVKTPDEEPGTNYPFGDECEHKARLVLEKAGVME